MKVLHVVTQNNMKQVFQLNSIVNQIQQQEHFMFQL